MVIGAGLLTGVDILERASPITQTPNSAVGGVATVSSPTSFKSGDFNIGTPSTKNLLVIGGAIALIFLIRRL